MKKTEQNKKVFVGMSGGVDSSVSALLLKQAGFDVTGVFIKVWYPDFFPCNWKEERRDAMRVSAKLGIPFMTLDLRDEYKKEVVDYMLNEYKAGRTPNPDVMCNRYVKFGGFLNKAIEMGVDYIATGHYAQNEETGGQFYMKESVDTNKDQTYFLWTLTQKDLARTLFPVGHLKKDEVRKIAKENDLPIFDKKDSQGLCFIGKIGMKEFLANYIEDKIGDVLNTDGEVIGNHNGAVFFTIGERHGFTITKKGSEEDPYFVIDKDIEKNTITVSSIPEEVSVEKSFALSRVNWINNEPDEKMTVDVRLRYRQEKIKAKIKKEKDKFFVYLETSVSDITPGQSCVVYNGEMVMGGGVIS